jgi:hypothetical protein
MRDFMEPRFGTDFSDVRVHTGSEAHALSADLHARAFTFGPDIWIGAKGNVADRNLMAHELAHVVQQRSAAPRIARRDEDSKSGGTAAPSGQYSGCDRKTTGIDDAAAVLDRARASALKAVAAARAAFKPLKSATIVLLDQHFHCPSTTNMMAIMKTLAAIEQALPGLSVECTSASASDCAGGNLGAATDPKDTNFKPGDEVKLHPCPPYFGAGVTEAFRAVTFIFATAIKLGYVQRCRRGEACYEDYTRTAADMMQNPYSYAWFAVEAAGLSPPAGGSVPCRPVETGFWVVVPPDARKDPSKIRRLNHSDPTPAGSEIVSVWSDTSGRYFIYYDVEGAKQYLPGEGKRYYFPEGTHP